ncbi:SMP-30/gluconolactonase/LRE family protein [Larsenimonas rhizosphaerae]|uniref:SMP-30/gluconolactonase/LRE family protein n=1 Tax=Larsenimonas rhizosphaerae TaxID=2944682 RepID=UPI002033B3D8|nr:SMP-30/gluconolactonase/LRE family protein [Larsenimonas rhizosphaerae]MCM2129623.1 SMP-30/gluconolactonase/LRE family protein [Larsenimonas rhizosphaerae]
MLTLHCRLTMTLGEGVFWDDATARLYWVDIREGRLYWLDPGESAPDYITIDEPLACVALHDDGGFVAATRSGLWRLDAEGRKQHCLVDGPQDSNVSWCNDGRCDARGRFWVGTKHDGESDPVGALFSYQQSIEQHLEGITIANGLAFSPDQRWLYHADSPHRRIDRHAFDLDTGRIGPATHWVDLDTLGIEGYPDGAAVDRNGHYWCALYAGSAVIELSPEGELLSHHPLPVPQPTKVAFGGKDRRTLFVTTARQHMSDEALQQAPLSGSLFSMPVDTAGLEDYRFRAY